MSESNNNDNTGSKRKRLPSIRLWIAIGVTVLLGVDAGWSALQIDPGGGDCNLSALSILLGGWVCVASFCQWVFLIEAALISIAWIRCVVKCGDSNSGTFDQCKKRCNDFYSILFLLTLLVSAALCGAFGGLGLHKF